MSSSGPNCAQAVQCSSDIDLEGFGVKAVDGAEPLGQLQVRLPCLRARRVGAVVAAQDRTIFGEEHGLSVKRSLERRRSVGREYRAQRAEPVHVSPLGLLVHPQWGLWHSYRGALALGEHIELPPMPSEPSPCERCTGKPCLAACPVGGFSAQVLAVARCVGHLRSDEGNACLSTGCLARCACPVAPAHRHGHRQAAFHQQAFLLARGE